jgi:biotin-(acetyl-CoA carboxylase) ligase
MFDFDRVDILAATGEEIERFVVQVGNDADEAQRNKYQKMGCHLSANVNISDNTRRILAFTFGHIHVHQ